MKKQKTNSYTLPADGEWHTLVEHSEAGPSSFLINGYSQGIRGQGYYAVIHAIALNAFNGKRGRINSSCNYGQKGRIVVSVESLLNDEFEHVE